MAIKQIRGKPIILTDIDGVVLDWFGALDASLKNKGIKTTMPQPIEWSLTHYIDSNKSQDIIKEFNHSPAFGQLKAFIDAKYMIPKISQDFTFIGVTACSLNEEMIIRRFNNLESVLPAIFYNIHFLDLGESKVEVLQQYEPAIWVEDNPDNAKAGAECGHKSFLISRSYNLRDNPVGVKRVDSWHDIYMEIRKK